MHLLDPLRVTLNRATSRSARWTAA
nr:hypothetical protein 7.2 [Burkholderia phage Bups phi1]